MIKELDGQWLKGVINVPPSKSDSQRALLAAALADGRSRVTNVGKSDDERSMIRNIQMLGAVVEQTEGGLFVTGSQAFPHEASINVGESGLGLRLITAICAVIGGEFTISGEGTIMNRLHHDFEEYLSRRGCKVELNEGRLPLHLNGKLAGGKFKMDGSGSSQFLSGLLMALPIAGLDSVIHVKDLSSTPYIDMTIDTLRSFGVNVYHDAYKEFRIKGDQRYKITDYRIESDWSSASYWIVASALGHQVSIRGLNEFSHQADRRLIHALENANCSVNYTEGDMVVNGKNRIPFNFDATHSPDLFPALVVLAAFCNGVSMIKGVNRLANKESNRAKVLQEEFGKLGVLIEIADDIMMIYGGEQLISTEVDSHHDHRIAMCLAIAGSMIKGGVKIINAEAVSKSYPSFWDDLESLTP